MAFVGILLLSLSLGCTSIYHRAQTQLPPDKTQVLVLSLREAKRAENLVEKAVAKLLNHLQRGNTGLVMETDFDRLEATAYDLERLVEAVREAATPSSPPGPVTDEIDRLSRKTQLWLEYVQACRHAEPLEQLEQLRARLP